MIAATFIGGIEFEIIQPIHGVNPYSKFLEERGPGIHHIKESVWTTTLWMPRLPNIPAAGPR